MPNFVCAICRDRLLEEPNLPVTALICGHVFHQTCISKWIVGVPSTENSGPGTERHSSCPSCRRPCLRASIRLFFEEDDSSDEEDTDPASLKANCKSLSQENKIKDGKILALSAENSQLRQQLCDKKTLVDKLKHACLMQMEEVRKNTNQRKSLISAMEEARSAKDTLEKEIAALREEHSKLVGLKSFLESNADSDASLDSLDANTLKAILMNCQKYNKDFEKSETILKKHVRSLVRENRKMEKNIKSLNEQVNLKSEIIKSLRNQADSGKSSTIVIDPEDANTDDHVNQVANFATQYVYGRPGPSTGYCNQTEIATSGPSTSSNTGQPAIATSGPITRGCLKRLRGDETEFTSQENPSYDGYGGHMAPDGRRHFGSCFRAFRMISTQKRKHK